MRKHKLIEDGLSVFNFMFVFVLSLCISNFRNVLMMCFSVFMNFNVICIFLINLVK